MSTFVHSLMIGVMLLHGVIGCCWHHAHSHDGALSDPHAACHGHARGMTFGHAGHDHDDHHHHGPVGPQDDSDSEEPQDPCEHGECVYLVGKSVELSTPVASFAPVPVVVELVDAAQVVLPVRAPKAGWRTPSETALAVCARLGVWRI